MSKFFHSFWLLTFVWLVIPFTITGQSNVSTLHIISVQNTKFVPDELHVQIGDSVIFQWTPTAIGHNVAQTSSSRTTGYEEGFRSGDPRNGPFNYTLPSQYLTENITLFYVCEPHAVSSGMRGKIIVGEGSSGEEDNGRIVGILVGTLILTAGIFAGIVYLQKRSTVNS